MTNTEMERAREIVAERDLWRCIGCGAIANLKAETGCECPPSLLFRRAEPNRFLVEASATDRAIVKLRAEIDRHKDARKETILAVQQILQQETDNG